MEKNNILDNKENSSNLKIGGIFSMFETEKTRYSVTRMVPPGKIRYVFSNVKKILLARDHPNIEFHKIPFKITVKYGKNTKKRVIMQTHHVTSRINYNLINEYNYVSNITIKPRIKDIAWREPTDIKVVIPWSKNVAVFKNFKWDTEK